MVSVASAVLSHGLGTAPPPGPEGDSVNALRFLAVDAVEAAGSGHPGTAMALAPLVHRLFTEHLRHDPAAPDWQDRDRFVLSIGHASLLLYGALHLSGYGLTAQDLARFRQWGSATPGHPEREVTAGVDINTGPLGQGFANGVGFAVAERLHAARFDRPGRPSLVDHRTWVLAGDGDMMEGISSEAASLAGHLGLGKLTVFYDDNGISLEGPTSLHFSEDVAARFAAYGWHVTRIPHVNDLSAIDRAIAEAVAETERPTLVVVHTHIGYGSPLQDTSQAHGAPLGPMSAQQARERLGWRFPPFEVPATVYAHVAERVGHRAAARTAWVARVEELRAEEPELVAEFERTVAGTLPAGWQDALPAFEPGTRVATRVASGRVLNALATVVPELVGGAADVGPSTETLLTAHADVSARTWGGRNLHFGVREAAMGAALNAMAAHRGLVVYGATFFVFSDYVRPAVRMAAIMQLPVVFVFTHDSIGLGEDGPTHQPVEHLASLRAMPGLRVLRPADANETVQAWANALRHPGPSVLVLSRQGLPVLDPALLDVDRGGSVVAAGDDVALVATGSEVEVALAARDLLAARGVTARVVSLPCLELFLEQTGEHRETVLPAGLPVVAVEAAATQSWWRIADDVVGLDRFGASAPAAELYEHFGITPAVVADRAAALLLPRPAA
jgi:transketolase